MPARFAVKKGTTGKFRFVLLAANRKVIATSELYESKAACMAGIRAVRRVAADAPVDDLTKPAAKAGAAERPSASKMAASKVAAIRGPRTTKARRRPTP